MKTKTCLLISWLLIISGTLYCQFDKNKDGLYDKETLLKSNHLKISQVINSEKSIPSPSDWIGDITSDGDYLWVGSSDGLLYKISPTTGDTVKTIDISINILDAITFDGKNLWIAENRDSKLIQKIDTADGTIISSFNHNVNNYSTHGMAYVNDHLWINMFYLDATDTTFVLDTLGNVVDKFPNNCKYSHGLVFDGNYFWISANNIGSNDTTLLYKYSKDSFERLDSMPVPGGDYPNGLCIHDNSLWLSNADCDSIYKIDIEITTPFIFNIERNESSFVFPNPFKSIITIDADFLPYNTTIELYNINGSKVLEKVLGYEKQIDLQSLHQGIYLIYIRENNKVICYDKIIKLP